VADWAGCDAPGTERSAPESEGGGFGNRTASGSWSDDLTSAGFGLAAIEAASTPPVEVSAIVEGGPGVGMLLIASVGDAAITAEAAIGSAVTTAAAVGLPEATLGESPAASDQHMIPTITTLTLAVTPNHKMSPASLGRHPSTVKAVSVRITPLLRGCLQSANADSLIKFNQ
jgi:hypothetical protein